MLTTLFQAVGLRARKAGDGGEAGYGIPDQGGEDSEAVMKKVRQEHVGTSKYRKRCSCLVDTKAHVVMRVLRLQHETPSPGLLFKVIAAYGGEQMKGADNKSEEKYHNDGPAPRRAPIGPAMPSQAMLAQAQQAAMDYVEQVRLWSGHRRCCWI